MRPVRTWTFSSSYKSKPRVAEPALAFLGLLLGMQVASAVDPGGDLVPVALGIARAEYLRIEATRKPVRGGEDTGDPLSDFPLASPLYSPWGHRGSWWVAS